MRDKWRRINDSNLMETSVQTQSIATNPECFVCGLKFFHVSELMTHLQIIQHKMDYDCETLLYMECYRCKKTWKNTRNSSDILSHQCLQQRNAYLKMHMKHMNETCQEDPYLCLCCARDTLNSQSCCCKTNCIGTESSITKFNSPMELAVHIIGKHNPNRIKNQCAICNDFKFEGKETRHPESHRWTYNSCKKSNIIALPQINQSNAKKNISLDNHLKKQHLRFYEMLYLLSRWKYKDMAPFDLFSCVMCKVLELFNPKVEDTDDLCINSTPELQTHKIMAHCHGGVFDFLKLNCQICSQQIHFSKCLGESSIPACKREHVHVLGNAQHRLSRSGMIPHTYIFDWETCCLFCLKDFKNFKISSEKSNSSFNQTAKCCALQVHIMVEHNVKSIIPVHPNVQPSSGTLFQYIEACGICGLEYLDFINEAKGQNKRLENTLMDLHREITLHENWHVKKLLRATPQDVDNSNVRANGQAGGFKKKKVSSTRDA